MLAEGCQMSGDMANVIRLLFTLKHALTASRIPGGCSSYQACNPATAAKHPASISASAESAVTQATWLRVLMGRIINRSTKILHFGFNRS